MPWSPVDITHWQYRCDDDDDEEEEEEEEDNDEDDDPVVEVEVDILSSGIALSGVICLDELRGMSVAVSDLRADRLDARSTGSVNDRCKRSLGTARPLVPNSGSDVFEWEAT
ncbi:Vacuolar cation/proton exchanger [Trichinella spiralis]|uniref:Vacuolar cation/proton exchanger n=1 Tax=Trichinella spiralis TaxID=6334 RepID=A0ABR3KJF9_TRISP